MHSSTSIVTGNVASDVRFTTTADGIPVASFRLAASERKFDREANRWVDSSVVFYSVACWRHIAENVHASIVKGDPVVVVGRTSLREWEKDGRTGTTLDITADIVGHDLTRGTARFERSKRPVEPEPDALAA